MLVISHGLINTLATIAGQARALQSHWDDTTPEDVLAALQLLDSIQDEALKGAELLGDVMRGVPPAPIETVQDGTGAIIRLP
jgi:hypothetical protein